MQNLLNSRIVTITAIVLFALTLSWSGTSTTGSTASRMDATLTAHGPTLPPDPDEEVIIGHGPTLPPDPDEEVIIGIAV